MLAAGKKAKGPTSFKVALLDSLYHLQPKQLAKNAKVVKLKA